MQAVTLSDASVVELTKRFTYLTGFHPASNLEASDILQCWLCWEDWFEKLDLSDLADARRITAWMKAVMLDHGRGFEPFNGILTQTSESACWFPPVLSKSVKYGEDFITLFMQLIKSEFDGEEIFEEFLRVTKVWEAGNGSFVPNEHHARIEACLGGSDSRGSSAAGVYAHVPPEIGSEITLGDISTPYLGSLDGIAAKNLGRIQVNIGQTVLFRKRELWYNLKGTNELHQAARQITLSSGDTRDTISAWSRKVLLNIPLKTGKNKKITSLFLRVGETILNVGYGATRIEVRPWGLQTTAIDHNTREYKIDDEGICDLLQWYGEEIVPHHPWGEVFKDFKNTDNPIWKLIMAEVSKLQRRFHEEKWEGVDADLVPHVSPLLSRRQINVFLRQEERVQDPETVPLIPKEHWGQGAVPDGWVKIYEHRGVMEEGAVETEVCTRRRIKVSMRR